MAAPTTLNPEQRSQRARAAALARWSREDPAPALAHTRAGFMARFYAEVDPEGTLPDAERERRAQAALRSHMARLALASSRKRAKGGGAR